MSHFRNYQEAHTEWAIIFMKFVEMILSFTCMVYHMEAVLYRQEPMPHNMLFCATFGGFFILSLAGVLVPFSGQLSPPGVDLTFSIIAFVLLFCSASAAMYYIAVDDHLTGDKMTDHEEAAHPFFRHCRYHCIMSLITGTFFLMHAIISADRLAGIRRGLDEPTDVVSLGSLPEVYVDIDPDTPITLYFFLLDWILYVWKLECTEAIKKCCLCTCCKKEERRRRKSMKRRRRLDPHYRAHILSLNLPVNMPTTSGEVNKTIRWSLLPEQKSSNIITTVHTLFQSEQSGKPRKENKDHASNEDTDPEDIHVPGTSRRIYQIFQP